jgi:hypothetical protein
MIYVGFLHVLRFPHVIVVGSGIAGLAAARTLVNTGKFSVNILEAKRERYGGRIFTDRKSLKICRGDVEDRLPEPITLQTRQKVLESFFVLCVYRPHDNGIGVAVLCKMCSDTTRAITNTNLVIDARYCPVLSSPSPCNRSNA